VCDSKRVRSSKKRGTKFLKWCPAGGGYEDTTKRNSYPPFVPPLSAVIITKIRFRRTVLDSVYHKFHKKMLCTAKNCQRVVRNRTNFARGYEVRSTILREAEWTASKALIGGSSRPRAYAVQRLLHENRGLR